MSDKAYSIPENLRGLQLRIEAAQLNDRLSIDMDLVALSSLIEELAAAEGRVKELEADNAFLKSQEAWKRIDSLSESVNQKTLTIRQMSIERKSLEFENVALREWIARLEDPVSDEEQEQYSNHTYVYGFRDACKELLALRAGKEKDNGTNN